MGRAKEALGDAVLFSLSKGGIRCGPRATHIGSWDEDISVMIPECHPNPNSESLGIGLGNLHFLQASQVEHQSLRTSGERNHSANLGLWATSRPWNKVICRLENGLQVQRGSSSLSRAATSYFDFLPFLETHRCVQEAKERGYNTRQHDRVKHAFQTCITSLGSGAFCIFRPVLEWELALCRDRTGF